MVEQLIELQPASERTIGQVVVSIGFHTLMSVGVEGVGLVVVFKVPIMAD